MRGYLEEFMARPACVFQKPDVLRAVLGCLPFEDLQVRFICVRFLLYFLEVGSVPPCRCFLSPSLQMSVMFLMETGDLVNQFAVTIKKVVNDCGEKFLRVRGCEDVLASAERERESSYTLIH